MSIVTYKSAFSTIGLTGWNDKTLCIFCTWHWKSL